MPKFTIENLNYIVTGKREKIISLDVYDTNLSTRTNNVSFFTETDNVDDSLIGETHFGTVGINKNVNPYGFKFLNGTNRVAYALFDVKDVAIRSKVASRIEKSTDIVSAYSDDNLSNKLDMYFPHLLKNPLGFVQFKEYSYGMTDNTVVAPVLKETTLYKSKIDPEVTSNVEAYSARPLWSSFLNPYDKYGSKEDVDPGYIENLIPIYMYTPLKNLKFAVSSILSAEYEEYEDKTELESKVASVTSSYAAFRDFVCDKYDSSTMISVLFKPVYNFQNIEHNYIMELPIDVAALDEDNAYEEGTVLGDMIIGKNVYDNIYDMNVSKVGDFERAREYKTIHQTGNRLFVNYFDDLSSKSKSEVVEYNNTYQNQTEDVELSSAVYPKETERDYVKVECIDAINRFISLTNHKANLFSVKIYGLNDVLNSSDANLEDITKNNIKTSIENSIRRIVTNFVPAHTQYFGVTEYNDETDDRSKSTENC